jgi:hypothetical protein
LIETAVCLAGGSAANPASGTTSHHRMIPQNKIVGGRNRLFFPFIRLFIAVGDSFLMSNLPAQRFLSLQ